MSYMQAMAAATAMDGEGWKFPAAPDVLVEILMRLPPSCRRLLRLVCRTWRDVVDQRTPEMRSRAAILVQTERSSYVVDNLSSGRRRELWTGRCAGDRYESMCVVGTCNGLLCLCDTKEPGGAITLANPATGEMLLLPLLPFSGQYYRPFRWGDGGIATSRHEAYCFAYLPATGKYRVVHVPCYPDPGGEFEAVQVFTLGKKSWRNVPTPGMSCNLKAGILSVDGAMYWLTVGTEKVMSLDLEVGRVTPVKSLPAPAGPNCHLTVVRGWLGIAISDGSSPLEKIEVFTHNRSTQIRSI
jgi:F-box interacting protein